MKIKAITIALMILVSCAPEQPKPEPKYTAICVVSSGYQTKVITIKNITRWGMYKDGYRLWHNDRFQHFSYVEVDSIFIVHDKANAIIEQNEDNP
jgi:hypothetical protein